MLICVCSLRYDLQAGCCYSILLWLLSISIVKCMLNWCLIVCFFFHFLLIYVETLNVAKVLTFDLWFFSALTEMGEIRLFQKKGENLRRNCKTKIWILNKNGQNLTIWPKIEIKRNKWYQFNITLRSTNIMLSRLALGLKINITSTTVQKIESVPKISS